jgi:hypothetical protein
MNIRIIISAISLCLLGLLVSCNNDELVYSCGKDIDAFIKKDLSTYSNIAREDWKDLPDSLKIPVYRTFSPGKCKSFWKEKEAELMKLQWSNEERTHILQLYSKIEEDLFTPSYFENESLALQWNNFLIQWVTYALEVLKWDYAMLYTISATGEEYTEVYLDNLRNELIQDSVFNAPYGGTNSLGGDCNCHSWFWCQFLRPGTWECKENGCTASSHGCGTLWLQSCDGKCESTDHIFNFNNGGHL